MEISDALKCLGASRVVWIDDQFNESSDDFASMLISNVEAAQACDLGELNDIVRNFDAVDTAADDVREWVDEHPKDVPALQELLLQKIAEMQDGTSELTEVKMAEICRMMGVSGQDQLSFDGADEVLNSLCKEGDSQILYMVDLNDARTGDRERGVKILEKLSDCNSRGTAFILTREADVVGEAQKERSIRDILEDRRPEVNPLKIPTCVIAKDRLLGKLPIAKVEDALRVAIKRAGLRRSVSEVLWKAEPVIHTSFSEAAEVLSSLSPEILEAFVVDRGFNEGVSELHVVERALTAHVSQSLRKMFAADGDVVRGAERMRTLREIDLGSADLTLDPGLEAFRRAEVWEEPELLNVSLSPIACGDVFEVFAPEGETRGGVTRLILLGQPCDVALRKGGKRAQDTGIFVPLKVLENPDKANAKTLRMPFKVGGVQWWLDCRKATAVRLAVLDLASFRRDGAVQFDQGQIKDPNLLPGQARAYARSTRAAQEMLTGMQRGKGRLPEADAPALRLTFDRNGPFNGVHTGRYHPGAPGREGTTETPRPPVVSWRLKRCGRVRSPNAIAMLDAFISIMTRQAYDIDFTDLPDEDKDVDGDREA